MGLLIWIIVGLIAGWLAGQVVAGHGYGVVGDIILGIVGALLGGFLASALFGIPNPINGINVGSIVVAFLGAVVLVLLLRSLPTRRRL